MTTAGPNYPSATTTVADSGDNVWSNPTNVYTDNSTFATTLMDGKDLTGVSDILKSITFGFAIPTGATINGILVEIDKKSSGTSTKDNTVQLYKAGTATGTNKADTVTSWATTEATISYGGAADLWGTTWTPSEINASTFGVKFKASVSGTNSRTASIDFIRVTITYTASGTTYNETATGGIVGAGLNLVKSIKSIFASAGAVCAGLSMVETTGTIICEGGAVCGGVATVFSGETFNEVASGGAVCSGVAWEPIRTCTIVASANHISGSPSYIGGDANYTVTRDNLDATYITITGTNASATFPLSDMPDNFSEAVKIKVLIRCHRGTLGDLSSLHSVQCFLADGTTALSAELIPGTIEPLIYTYALETDSLTSALKSDWDVATFKITSDEGEASFYVEDFSIYMTYSRRLPETYNINGGGGAVVNGISPVYSKSTFNASGGAVVNGIAIAGMSYNNTIQGNLNWWGLGNIEGGGVRCGGTSIVSGNVMDEIASGGVVCGGINKAGFIFIADTTTGAYLWGGTPLTEGPIGYVNWCATTGCGCRVMDFEPEGNFIFSGSSTIIQEKIGVGGLILRGKTKISWNGSGTLNWLIPLGDLRKHPYEIINGLRTAGTNLYRRNGVFCLPSSQFVSEDESNCLIEADTIAAGQDFALSFWCRTPNRFVQRCLFVRGNYVPLTTGNWSVKISVGHYGQIVLEAQDILSMRYEIISEDVMNDEFWQHIAISVESNVITLFINGVAQETQIELSNNLGASNGNSIGVHSGRSFPDCHLQEFRCYNDYKIAEYWLAEYANFCDYSNFVTVGEVEEFGVSVV